MRLEELGVIVGMMVEYGRDCKDAQVLCWNEKASAWTNAQVTLDRADDGVRLKVEPSQERRENQ